MQVRDNFIGERGSQFLIRGRGVDRVVVLLVVCALAAWCFCGCVKVTTGATPEESSRISEDVASRIRAEWAEKVRTSSPLQHVRLLQSLCVKVMDSYIGIGYETVEKWQKMEDIQGGPVCETEIQRMLDNWRVREEAVFSAYEDNIRYTLEEIATSGYFNDDVIMPLETLVAQYERVSEVAFRPVDSPGDYAYILEQLEYETERVSLGVKEALKAL